MYSQWRMSKGRPDFLSRSPQMLNNSRQANIEEKHLDSDFRRND